MATFPDFEIIQQNPAIDPSGFRHLKQTIHGYVKNLDTGAAGVLDYGSLNTTGSGAISDTKLIYGRVNDFGSASGVMNMRFYWHSISDWGAGTYRFLERKAVHFTPNVTLNAGDRNTPTTVPQFANVSGTRTPGWTGGSPWISGIADGDVTFYIWLAVLAGVDVPVGTYGGAGAGGFRGRILYDFS